MENVSVSAGGWLATLEERSDPRVSSWPLMSSPLPTLLLCLAYLAVVKVVGPLYMEGRKPYDLKLPMLAYNLFQVMFNGWIFLGPALTFSCSDLACVSGAASFWFGGEYNWLCQPVDYSSSPGAMRALSLAWWFYLSKFIDFFDSLFFLLRGKGSHKSRKNKKM